MNQRFVSVLLAAVLAVNLYVGFRHFTVSAEAAGNQNVYAHMEKFSRVLEQVRRNYVDEEKVSYDKLMEGALKGMLSVLDPHSEYMPADRHKALVDDTRQQYESTTNIFMAQSQGFSNGPTSSVAVHR